MLKTLILLALPRESNPCFSLERAQTSEIHGRGWRVAEWLTSRHPSITAKSRCPCSSAQETYRNGVARSCSQSRTKNKNESEKWFVATTGGKGIDSGSKNYNAGITTKRRHPSMTQGWLLKHFNGLQPI